tara:strand:+ start:12 stop:1046 length:1035 start_codon:yes stop_codon:yes gene_type:complete
MTVVNPKSISGINSITMASGSDNLLTIHANDTSEKVRVNSSGDVIVGSGVTLSPDGDVFFTGIATGNGSGLTNLATDLVNDTSPQLGGDLQSNGHDIKIADASGYDGGNIYMGSDNDMRIHHDGSNFEMSNSTGTIYLRTDSAIHIQKQDGSTKIAEFNADADCELYHNGTKQCETSASGLAFPSGKGIDFSATGGPTSGSGTGELLDDYEEGTFTPEYNSGSANSACFASGITYSSQVGHYVKVGNLVTYQLKIDPNSSGLTAKSGTLQINNLPFNASNVQSNGGAYFVLTSAFGATDTLPNPVQITGSNGLQFYKNNAGGFAGTDLPTPANYIQLAGFYHTS